MVLQWTTASETNNAGFEIERALENSNVFERIGFVRGNGTTTEAQSYQFTDTATFENVAHVTYRLKQIDFDGTFAYSDAIQVALPAPVKLALHKNFPNPFNPVTVIRYDVPQNGPVRLSVYDATGRQIAVLVDQEVAAGRYQTHFDATNLASGVYFYRLETTQSSITNTMLLAK